MQCATHLNVETQIRCSRCEKPICQRCMVETPVGHRCTDCAQVRRHPVLTLRPQEALRAVAAAIALAFAGGVVWAILDQVGALGGLLLIAAAIGIGYATSEGISRAANRKRAPALPVMAGLSVLASFFIGNVLSYLFWTDLGLDFALRARNIFNVSMWEALSLLLAIALAVTRLRA